MVYHSEGPVGAEYNPAVQSSMSKGGYAGQHWGTFATSAGKEGGSLPAGKRAEKFFFLEDPCLAVANEQDEMTIPYDHQGPAHMDTRPTRLPERAAE